MPEKIDSTLARWRSRWRKPSHKQIVLTGINRASINFVLYLREERLV